MSSTGPGAPPCNGPLSAPTAPTTAEIRSDPVDATIRAVNVDALIAWSITVTKYASSAVTAAGAGAWPRLILR